MSLADNTMGTAGIAPSEAMPSDYFALLKPRVMSLVIFTALVGILVAPGATNPVVAAVSLLAIAVGAGASGALNQWYDADIDAIMTRTRGRPVPAGRILPREALGFGLVLSVLSVLSLSVFANLVAGALLAFTIFFYVVVYTMWLKRSTPQNIVIGGASGALPPVVGWAAVTGTVSLDSLVLFLIIFLWTPPHFWALALFRSGDYGAAGVPMLPVVAGEASTKRHIFAYSLVLAVVGILPSLTGLAGPAYGVVAAVLGAVFVLRAHAVLRMDEADRSMAAAKALFGYSLVYLFAVFATLLAEHFIMASGLWGTGA